MLLLLCYGHYNTVCFEQNDHGKETEFKTVFYGKNIL